jgi:hypothetical protein
MDNLFGLLDMLSIVLSFIFGLFFIYLSKNKKYIDSVIVDVGHDLGMNKIRRLNLGGIVLCIMSFFLFIGFVL